MNINAHLTHINYPEDIPFLRSKLFDVNLRLLKSSEGYRKVIFDACVHIDNLASTTFEGYKKPHGMSGANAGIPLNIISIVQKRGKIDEQVLSMINPKILSHDLGGMKVLTKTNCGSIRLEEPISVSRYKYITVEWFNINGERKTKSFGPDDGGFVIQHEIDHNLGILITDYK